MTHFHIITRCQNCSALYFITSFDTKRCNFLNLLCVSHFNQLGENCSCFVFSILLCCSMFKKFRKESGFSFSMLSSSSKQVLGFMIMFENSEKPTTQAENYLGQRSQNPIVSFFVKGGYTGNHRLTVFLELWQIWALYCCSRHFSYFSCFDSHALCCFPLVTSSALFSHVETRWWKALANFADFKVFVCGYIDRWVQISDVF